jgi:hypothetical protein
MLFAPVMAAAAAVATLPLPRRRDVRACLVIRRALGQGASLVCQAGSIDEGLALMAAWVERYPECQVLVRAGDAVIASHLP